MKLISWNVNGIRAAAQKGLVDWFNQTQPDILCLQETRASAVQIPDELTKAEGYHSYWLEAQNKKGYSGAGLLSKTAPLQTSYGIGNPEYDIEGRVIIAEYEHFTLMNAYFPSGTSGQDRVDYKLAFNDAFLEAAESIRAQGKRLIFCGDINTAHQPIDLARPKTNEKTSGFMPIERAWIDKIVGMGYIDAFRHLHPNAEGQYSWWSSRGTSRQNNIGWRIDYFFITQDLVPTLTEAFILPDVGGSDHCPVGIVLDLNKLEE